MIQSSAIQKNKVAESWAGFLQRLFGVFSSKKAWSINPKLYQAILKTLPKKGTLLELGSGPTTERLTRHFNVYSIEHSEEFLHKYGSRYIHAPIVNGWYCRKSIQGKLPHGCDGILVDGPPSIYGRHSFLDNIDLFDVSGYLYFDDVERSQERSLIDDISKKLKRDYEIYEDQGKSFAIFKPVEEVSPNLAS